jgi:peptidylprolyl isomerase
MMMRYGLAALCWAVMSCVALAQAPDPLRWRALDPEETLYVDTDHGRIVIEMYPEIAPDHVARIKTLAREGFYDGLTFHRVIDGFMAQGGDPLGTGEGASALPDLQAEFRFRRGPEMPFVEAARQAGARQGFYKALPIATQNDELMESTSDGRVAAWGLHCPGVASMARWEDFDSANSQFFLMRAAYPSLDSYYSIWGRVVWGMDSLLALEPGDPPVTPQRIVRVRVAADLPPEERAPIYVMRTDTPDFRRLLERQRRERGADFSLCDVEVPARVPRDDDERGRPWWRIIPFIN